MYGIASVHYVTYSTELNLKINSYVQKDLEVFSCELDSTSVQAIKNKETLQHGSLTKKTSVVMYTVAIM